MEGEFMKFKKCKFKGKREVRKEAKDEINQFIKKNIPYDDCNEGLIFQYIDLLLDETEYDVKRNTFYFRSNRVKVDLSITLLKNVALEYIKEHMVDFLLEKY